MIQIQAEDFDVGQELKKISSGDSGIGAVCSFVGLVRDFSGQQEGDKKISSMTLEHYPGMTEKQLEKIECDARARWELSEVIIIHRIGALAPGDQIVLVVVASAHRDAAFEAARFIMDFLKTKATFWKKEETGSGAKWVEAKSSDSDSVQRWEKK